MMTHPHLSIRILRGGTHGTLAPRFLFALPLIAVLTACGPTSFSADEHLERGVGFQEAGDLRAASIEYRNALQRDPESAEGRYRLGMLLLTGGDPAGAEHELIRARDLGWDLDEVRMALMRVSLIQGQYGRVMEETRPIESFPEAQVAEALALRGLALTNMGNPGGAREILAAALDKDPAQVDALIGMAIVLYQLDRDVETAQKWIQQALEADPQYAQAWAVKGDLEQAAGNLDAAEQAYDKAIEYSPSPYAYHLGRAMTRVAQDNLEGAGQDLHAMRRLGPQHPATGYLEGLIHYQERDFAEAQSALEGVVANTREFMPAILLLGASHFAQGHWQQAERQLERYLRARPESDEAARLLAMVRLRDGDLDRAEALLNPVVLRRPDDTAVLTALSNLHLARGDSEQGIAYLRQLASLSPDDPSSRTMLARALLQSGDREEGLRVLESAIELAPDARQLEVARILTLIRGGEYAAALEGAERLQAAMPESSLPQNLKAGAYLAMGDIGRALESFQEALRVNPGDPSASVNLSAIARAQGDVPEARRIMRESLEHHPEHLEVLMGLSQLEGEQGNTVAMVRYLEQASRAHPESERPRIVLGRYHLSQNQPALAVSVLEPLAGTSAGNEERVLELVASAQLAAGQNTQAVSTLRSLSEVVSDTAPARFRLGTSFVQAERPAEAERQFRRTLELDPEHLEAMHALAGLQAQAGRTDEAMTLARRMQRVAPEAPNGFSVEGVLHTAAGKHADATQAYRAAYERSGSPHVLRDLVNAYQRSGQPGEAAAALSQHLESNPEDDGLRFELARTWAEMNQRGASIREYERLLERHPDDFRLLNNLAVILGEEQDPRALDYAERAFAQQPENLIVADTLGWILVQRGELDRGLQLLERARSGLPENAGVRYHYAAALAKMGRHEQARQELAALLRGETEFAQRANAEKLLFELEAR